MKAINLKLKFDPKKLQELLLKENQYVTHLFSILPIPPSALKNDDDSETENEDEKKTAKPVANKTSRAQSLTELQERLDAIRKTKKRMSYKDKLLQKGIKNRMKKKTKQHSNHKMIHATKQENEVVNEEGEAKPSKPVFNSEDKMVFSKIDFSNLGNKKEKKLQSDPKKLLLTLKKQKEKLEKLEAEGETEKAIEIKEKYAWKNALSKAQGQKVKDDPELLKKSVKKQEQKKRTSKKKWDTRLENVTKQKEERQKKRTDNIEKRKKDKKNHKLKREVKKGKVIPGY